MNKSLATVPVMLIALTAVLVQTGCLIPAPNPLLGGIKVYPGGDNTQQEQTTAPQTVQPPAQTSATNERQIVITQANSIFSIGLPAGYKEERQVTAEKPINIWFEYLPSDAYLEINGAAVELPVRRSTAKLGYTAGVTSFSYVIKNPTAAAISYNLHMEPATAGQQVPAVTQEKWTAP